MSSHIINSLDKEKRQAADVIHYQPVENEFVWNLEKHDTFSKIKS